MKLICLAVVLFIAVAGCTVLRYDRDTGEVEYRRVLTDVKVGTVQVERKAPVEIDGVIYESTTTVTVSDLTTEERLTETVRDVVARIPAPP